MKNKRTLFYLVVSIGVLFVVNKTYAQQESQYTQYMYNPASINPAYIGSKNTLNILSLYRTQWIGLDGAPEVLNLGLYAPIGIKNVGAGLGFTNDRIGPSSQNNLHADFSYTISITENTRLAFGLRAGLSLLSVDPNKLNIRHLNDHNLDLKNYQSPMMGTGFYLFHESWYLGASIPNLLETKYYNEVQVSTATRKSHLYFMGGYVFTLSPDLQFKPAFLTKYVQGIPLSVDFSANALMYNSFTLGVGYRIGSSVSALAGFQINENIMIGYSYDYETNELSQYNSGSHELFLRFEFRTRSCECSYVRSRFY